MSNEPSVELRARIALEKHGFHANHSLGQNFILNGDLIDQLLEEANLGAEDNVLEIGPGAGVMTCKLAETVHKVLAVEVDRTLEPVLDEVLSGHDNATVVFKDFMKCDVARLIEAHFGSEPYRVVANLPYYITSDILLRLVNAARKPDSIVIMVQKEAAERMMAAPGEKQWCALSATLQYFATITPLVTIPPEVFTPSPHVFSQLIRLDLYDEKPVQPKDEKIMLRLINACFGMRRKTLANNLKASFGMKKPQELILAAGLSELVRGETLTLDEICKLADLISENNA